MTTPAAPKPDDTTLAELLKRVVTLEADFVALGTVVTTITNAYALGRATTTGAFEIAAAERHDLEARVTALEDKTAPPPEPDEYQARLKLNTASKDDRPQALANLNAAKVRIRRQAFTAADLEAPDWCAACGNIAVAWPGVVCDICQNEAKS